MALNTKDSRPTLLDRAESARYLRSTETTMARWRCLGTGPAFIKLGGKILYEQSALDEFIAKSRRTSTSSRSAV